MPGGRSYNHLIEDGELLTTDSVPAFLLVLMVGDRIMSIARLWAELHGGRGSGMSTIVSVYGF
jgi:hypothetical protein